MNGGGQLCLSFHCVIRGSVHVFNFGRHGEGKVKGVGVVWGVDGVDGMLKGVARGVDASDVQPNPTCYKTFGQDAIANIIPNSYFERRSTYYIVKDHRKFQGIIVDVSVLIVKRIKGIKNDICKIFDTCSPSTTDVLFTLFKTT